VAAPASDHAGRSAPRRVAGPRARRRSPAGPHRRRSAGITRRAPRTARELAEGASPGRRQHTTAVRRSAADRRDDRRRRGKKRRAGRTAADRSIAARRGRTRCRARASTTSSSTNDSADTTAVQASDALVAHELLPRRARVYSRMDTTAAVCCCCRPTPALVPCATAQGSTREMRSEPPPATVAGPFLARELGLGRAEAVLPFPGVDARCGSARTRPVLDTTREHASTRRCSASTSAASGRAAAVCSAPSAST